MSLYEDLQVLERRENYILKQLESKEILDCVRKFLREKLKEVRSKIGNISSITRQSERINGGDNEYSQII